VVQGQAANGAGNRLLVLATLPLHLAEPDQRVCLAKQVVERGAHVPRGGLSSERGLDLPGLVPQQAHPEQRVGLAAPVADLAEEVECRRQVPVRLVISAGDERDNPLSPHDLRLAEPVPQPVVQLQRLCQRADCAVQVAEQVMNPALVA